MKARDKESADSFIFPANSGIRIRKILNASVVKGQKQAFGESWQVTVPKKLTGDGRKRQQFTTKQAAKSWAQDQSEGVQRLGHEFFHLKGTERREVIEAVQLLRKHNLPILEAARFAVKVMRPEGGDRTVNQVVDEILASQKKRLDRGSLRPESERIFRIRAQRFAQDFGDQPIKAIGSQAIRDWLTKVGGAARTSENWFTVLRTVFRFAQDKKYLGRTPFEDFTDDDREEIFGILEPGRPSILTPAEATRLLKAAHKKPDLDLLAPVVLALFCGIRTEELTKLKWSDVKLDANNPEESYVSISEKVARKRNIRHVPIPANARAWLERCPRRTGQLTRQDLVKRTTTGTGSRHGSAIV